MTVGELARRAGVRASTIRYYERRGLLPAPPRRSGWRQFDPDALAQLTVVQFAICCGFTLKETHQLVKGFGARTTMSERWRSLAQAKIAEMDASIERARQMKELLVRISRCECGAVTECGKKMLRKRAASSA
jgi:MerR family transcriptional regulator, redox-sensitive transcriptional activator SoxR